MEKIMRKNKNRIASFRNPFKFTREEDIKQDDYEQKEEPKPKKNNHQNDFDDSRSLEIPIKRKKTHRKGRPKKAKGTKRDKRITFCCTATEARQIKLYSFERDLSVSEFIMRCVYQHLKKNKN